MQDAQAILGFTDWGQPIISAEYHCPYWLPGKAPTLNSKTCWYCRYADFRKTTDAVLFQSVCRCPENRVGIVRGQKNEAPETKGGHEP